MIERRRCHHPSRCAILIAATIIAITLTTTSTAVAQSAPTTAPLASEPGRVRLTLPPVIYATPSIESNVYYQNVALMLNPANYAFDITCAKGKQMAERWAYTPEAGDTGDHPMTIEVRDESNAVIARTSTIVRVTRADAGKPEPVSMLLIGASLTQAAVYPQQLLDLAKADEHVAIKLIGSRGAKDKPADGELRHEGYNGWTAQAFVTLHGPLSRTGVYKRPDTGSPFVYEDQPGKLTLDFKRYYDQFNEGKAPDFITIHLGPNEIFSCTDDTIDSTIDTAFGYYDQLIAKIREAGPDTRIGIVLVGPATNSQDGFRNYAGTRKQTAWQYKRNHHRLIERMIKYYGNREKENLYLVPANVNLDVANHYPTWTSPRNARSSEKVTRVNNGTHPADEGYRQAGDMIYCWLKAMLVEQK